jgi:hypothetical protein
MSIDLPIFSDDEDDDSVRPKYLSFQDYSEILYSPIEVDLKLVVDINLDHLILLDGELHFVDIALRKLLLDSNFNVWNVEIGPYSMKNIKTVNYQSHLFSFDYHGMFTVVSKCFFKHYTSTAQHLY